VGAWRYVADIGRFRPASTNAPTLRPGVWYRAAFAQDVLKKVVAKKKDGDLPALLKIDESKLVSSGKSRSYTYHTFLLEDPGELDITGFSRMTKRQIVTLELGNSQRRYYITLKDIPQTNRLIEEKTAYEVTEHIDRIVEATDAKLKWVNGRSNRYRFPSKLACWRLTDNLTFAVDELDINFRPTETNSFYGSAYGTLLIRR